MKTRIVCLMEDVDERIEEALQLLNSINGDEDLSYANYESLYNIICKIGEMKTFVMEV